jgi:hypothetical protein
MQKLVYYIGIWIPRKSESEEELAEMCKEDTVTWFALTFCIHFSPVCSLLYVISFVCYALLSEGSY